MDHRTHNWSTRTPHGQDVKANARGINFNKHVTGDNLFMMAP
jgi:hypothetical protein